MSKLYLAQPAQQQQLEWLDGGTLTVLLDAAATDGQLMMGRFDVRRGEAPPYHKHLHDDEIFMLIAGTALVWYDDQEYELAEGGVVFLPKNVPHAYRITSDTADLLVINTSEIDFVERSEDLQQLLRRLQDPVKGTQYFLPLGPSE